MGLFSVSAKPPSPFFDRNYITGSFFFFLVKQHRQHKCVRWYLYRGVGGLTSWVMTNETLGIPGQWYPQWSSVCHLKYLYIKHHCFLIGQKTVVWLYLVSLYCEMCNYSMSAQLNILVWQHLQGYCTFWHPKLNPGQKTPVPWPQPASYLINGNMKTEVKHNCYPLFCFFL